MRLHCKCLFYPDWPTQRCCTRRGRFPAAKTVMVRYYASCLVNCGTNRERENASRARLCESLTLDARNALNLSVTFLLIHANPLQIGLSIACRAPPPSARPPPPTTRRFSVSREYLCNGRENWRRRRRGGLHACIALARFRNRTLLCHYKSVNSGRKGATFE